MADPGTDHQVIDDDLRLALDDLLAERSALTRVLLNGRAENVDDAPAGHGFEDWLGSVSTDDARDPG